MDLEIGPCCPGELPTVVSAVDDEFIFGKGRHLGLATRFPRLFTPENLGNVLVARTRGQIVATASARPFSYEVDGRRWKCAAVGAVWTSTAHRGKGLGSRIMSAMQASQAAAGCEALILWTSLHAFYGRLGWMLEDAGCFARIDGSALRAEVVRGSELSMIELEELEKLRRRSADGVVERARDDWSAIPIPSSRVEAFVVPGAYALMGLDGSDGYVYEIEGDPASLPILWRSIQAAAGRIFINAKPGPVLAWLAKEGIVFTPQKLTMWMPLTKASLGLRGRFFLPYLDRI